MNDLLTKIDSSIVQHGKDNDRIYLIKLNDNPVYMLYRLDELSDQYKYTKIFAKVPADVKQLFIDHGYRVEASIPKFYKGQDDVYFLAKYFSDDRLNNKDTRLITDILDTAAKKSKLTEPVKIKDQFHCRKCIPEDVPKMVNLYERIFKSYPFPINNQDYLLKTMLDNVIYFGIWDQDEIIALSSAEMDLEGQNAEMTDFAVLPEYSGNNFSVYLLQQMEAEMWRNHITCLYTIARSYSYGINITFSKNNYIYAGTLTNNTNICGNIESMNVWYKTT